MVDLQTAMAAAAAGRKQRAGAASEERKVRRSGPSLGIEPFDPVSTLVRKSRHCFNVVGNRIFCSCIVDDAICLDAKYLSGKVRHSLPNAMSAIILIPQVHRMVMPKSFEEFYGKGTWFKAGFLHTFTFLAMSFLLVNPPMGDIVAPKLASHWAIATDDGEILLFNEDSSKDGIIEWEVENDGRLDGEVWLLFALADNVNSDGAEVKVELTHQSVVTELASDDYYWANNSDRITNATKTDNSSAPNLVPHSKDQPFALILAQIWQ